MYRSNIGIILGAFISSFQISPSFCTSSYEEHFNAAVTHFQQQNYQQAIAAFQKAISIDSTMAQPYFNLALITLINADYTQAIVYLKKAIERKPDYVKAYNLLAQAYQELKQSNQAIENYTKVLELDPHNDQIHYNLGFLYKTCGNTKQALKHYIQFIDKNQTHINALFDLAYLHTVENNYDTAITLYKKVLHIDPTINDAANNLAHVLRYIGRVNEAIPYYKQIIGTTHNAQARYGLAECYLTLGNFELGLPEFEWRWKREPNSRDFQTKLWDGNTSLHNKTILIRAEYGQGDTVQFIRYALQLKKLGATVILEAQDTLVQLLSACPYIDSIIPVADKFEQLPYFDVQIPVMSLPHIFKTTLTTIPTPIPYIYPEPSLVNLWKERLKNDPNIKIGICWEGSPYYEQFKTAYSKKVIQLSAFIPLAHLENVSLYSLQKMNGTEQLKQLPSDVKIHDFGDSFDMQHGRFMDTAAVIQNLDLVITVDTSIAHLAGAMGKPVWVLLPIVADWRWMVQRSDSPWYPSMTLFRQKEVGNWTHVIQTVCSHVETLVKKKFGSQESSKTLSVFTEVQVGELIDKITILQIKMERIKDATKLKNIKAELDSLLATCHKEIHMTDALTKLWQSLKVVNEKLWVIEDEIREKERAKVFDETFIALARSVYYTNDERCAIKRQINQLCGSRLIEEKSYTNYT